MAGSEPPPPPPPPPKTEELEELPSDSPLAFKLPGEAEQHPQIGKVKPMVADANPVSLPPPSSPPAVKAPEPNEPENKHAFLGPTGQPGGLGIPFSSNAPDWAAPYDLIPMDPMAKAGAASSEFGSSPVASDPEAAPANFAQGHAIAPPGEAPLQPTPTAPTGVDSARSAVDQALAAASFNPADQPVQALNAQPFGTEDTIAHEPIPAMTNSDTPMLVLPGENNSSAAATQPIATQAPQTSPPPLPPPLVTSSGAVVPSAPPPAKQ
jgi:hypothetical protein